MIQEVDLQKVSKPDKKAYTTPSLIEWGIVKDLTRGDDPDEAPDGGGTFHSVSGPI